MLLGVVAAVLVTGAGACNPSHDGPLPSPDEAGAEPLPDGAVTEGLDAVYAQLSDTEGDGTRCYHLYRLQPDGEARYANACSKDGPYAAASARGAWSTDPDYAYVGDYGYLDGRIWIRLVSWDFIPGDYALSRLERRYCDTELPRIEPPPPNRTEHPLVLVAGSGPPDAEPC